MDEYYWTKEDFKMLKKAASMPELLAIAGAILGRMPQPVALVSGPISTGGRGSVAKNLKAFADAIGSVKNSGQTVFNQLPFEGNFAELAKQSSLPYFTPILDEFFLPILKSGKIAKVYFMPGWQSSIGAKWEAEMAETLGIKKTFLTKI